MSSFHFINKPRTIIISAIKFSKNEIYFIMQSNANIILLKSYQSKNICTFCNNWVGRGITIN